MQRSVKIKLDKQRTLKYTWGSLRYLKDEHKLLVGSLDTIAEDWTLFAPWLVAGLRHEDPDLTVDDFDDLPTDPDQVTMIVEKIVEAMGLAEKNEVPKDKDPTGSPQTTTGVNSTVSPTVA